MGLGRRLLSVPPYMRYAWHRLIFFDLGGGVQVASLGRLLGSPLTRVKLSAVAALHRLTEGKDHIRTNDPREIRVSPHTPEAPSYPPR